MNIQQCNKFGKACDSFKIHYSVGKASLGSKETIHKCKCEGYNFSVVVSPQKDYLLRVNDESYFWSVIVYTLQEALDKLLGCQHITLQDYLKILKMKEQLNAT